MRLYLDNSNIFVNFGAWIGGSCKPSDKEKLTLFPHFTFCQQNLINVSNMLRFEELPEINSERWLSLEDLPGEEWRFVDDYKEIENLIMISNYGRLKKIEHTSRHSKGGLRKHKERIYHIQSRRGYMVIYITIKGIYTNFSIHRLVAKAFLPNPNNYPCVNHKDENPSNNCVYNLEWCTVKYNTNYGTAIERKRETSKNLGYFKPVVLYDYEGNVLEEFESIGKASSKYGNAASIYECCTGKVPTASGLHFRFKGEKYIKRKINKKSYTCTLLKDGQAIYTTTSIRRMGKFIGISPNTIQSVLYGYHNCSDVLKPFNIRISDPLGNVYILENGKLKQ